ncbi:MAG: substrate-binding domain-containing protein [Pseudomonadota bacterium]
MNRRHYLVSALALVCASVSAGAYADTVKLCGSSTVVAQIIKPHREAAEKASGHTLEIVANGTGKGLADLVAGGKCDAAMSSDFLEDAVAAATKAGAKVDAKTLVFHNIKTDEIVFIVHPSNTVGSLSWEQIKDIHTGKITNWKDVGGKDLPITVNSEVPSGGNGAMIKHAILGGADFAATTKLHDKPVRVYEMVKGDEKGIGGLGKGLIGDAGKVKIIQTKKLERPLAIITVGEASAKVKQVIDALKAASK